MGKPFFIGDLLVYQFKFYDLIDSEKFKSLSTGERIRLLLKKDIFVLRDSHEMNMSDEYLSKVESDKDFFRVVNNFDSIDLSKFDQDNFYIFDSYNLSIDGSRYQINMNEIFYMEINNIIHTIFYNNYIRSIEDYNTPRSIRFQLKTAPNNEIKLAYINAQLNNLDPINMSVPSFYNPDTYCYDLDLEQYDEFVDHEISRLATSLFLGKQDSIHIDPRNFPNLYKTKNDLSKFAYANQLLILNYYYKELAEIDRKEIEEKVIKESQSKRFRYTLHEKIYFLMKAGTLDVLLEKFGSDSKVAEVLSPLIDNNEQEIRRTIGLFEHLNSSFKNVKQIKAREKIDKLFLGQKKL